MTKDGFGLRQNKNYEKIITTNFTFWLRWNKILKKYADNDNNNKTNDKLQVKR